MTLKRQYTDLWVPVENVLCALSSYALEVSDGYCPPQNRAN